MAYILASFHIIIALFFAVHALRNNRQLYWLIILFSFPMLGSLVYFFVEYLAASRVERGAKKATNIAIQLFDPSRELREARAAFDLTPTVQNRIRLAAALDNAGEFNEAVEQFEACLNGPFANDPEVCFGAAKAKLHVNQNTPALQLLQDLRLRQKEFRPEQMSILMAQALAANQQNDAAKTEFENAVNNFGSAEARGQYALWAAKNGDLKTAKDLRETLEKDWQHWNKHTRSLYKNLFDAVDSAIAATKNS